MSKDVPASSAPLGNSHGGDISSAPGWRREARSGRCANTPRHYRTSPPADMPRKAPSAASGRRRGSDGALRVRSPAPRPPTPRASSSCWRGTHPCRADRGLPPAGRSGCSRRRAVAHAAKRPLRSVHPDEDACEERAARPSVPRGMDPHEVTRDVARALLALPRTVGQHPVSGETILAGPGRYGARLNHGPTYACRCRTRRTRSPSGPTTP